MIDERELRRRLVYMPKTGLFFWLRPPKRHPRLFGEIAGHFNHGYCVIQIDGIKYKRARLAHLYMTGRWPTEMIDHINGETEDDRWANLREATHQQNTWNWRRRRNSNLPAGVRIAKSGRFVARITHNHEQITLGTFDTADAAAQAYQNARGELYGQFA